MGIGRLSLRRMFERILHALGFFLEFEAEQPSKGMIMSRRSLLKIQKIINLDNSFLLFQIKKCPASTLCRVLIGWSSAKIFPIDRSSRLSSKVRFLVNIETRIFYSFNVGSKTDFWCYHFDLWGISELSFNQSKRGIVWRQDFSLLKSELW